MHTLIEIVKVEETAMNKNKNLNHLAKNGIAISFQKMIFCLI